MPRPDRERTPHWISHNRAERIPSRWFALDTESRSSTHEGCETQTWRLGVASFWRTDLKTRDDHDEMYAETPEDLWEWVTGHCRAGHRSVLWCHNLGHDARISRMFTCLPDLGWELDWFNLSSDVSTIVWRSGKGTLVCTDLFTWLPVSLSSIGAMLGMPKLRRPPGVARLPEWVSYCRNDVAITEAAVRTLVQYIKDEHLGNWQATGAGMAYSAWRHKFLNHKILVHDDIDALAAERAAMHTGRAEAWRHGTVSGGVCAQWDMRMSYCKIAAECDMPVKLKYHDKKVQIELYKRLSMRYRCLARVRVVTTVPTVPACVSGRTVWPVGEFETVLWDTEIDLALSVGATITILEMWRYTKAPVLREWAQWCLNVCDKNNQDVHPVVRTWIKHCSRALIGRISLRSKHWEKMGLNPSGFTGITLETDAGSGRTRRLMHAGDVTLEETGITEGDSSLPQITGWIMAECRRRLWLAMSGVGLDRVVHVDTDAVIVAYGASERVPRALPSDWPGEWVPKGAWRAMTVYGPRNYRAWRMRKTAGVPLKATETAPNEFAGERWESLSRALREGRDGAVVVRESTWVVKRADPRRGDDGDRPGFTLPLEI